MVERIIPIQLCDSNEPEDLIDSTAGENQSASSGNNSSKTEKKHIYIKPANYDQNLEKYAKFLPRSGTLSSINVPEKIILVIDRGEDDLFTPFMSNGIKYSPLKMLKEVANLFVSLKHKINPKHEFALIVLNENNAQLVLEFSNDIQIIQNRINRITACQTEDVFNLEHIFNYITEVDIPKDTETEPPYILRTIMFYSRSYTVPKLQITDTINSYLNNKYFIFDILVTHEPVSAPTKINKIFTVLQDIDTKGYAYFLPVGRDMKLLFNSNARLLGHPLQRPVQNLVQ